nr:sigma B [Duck reovirus]
MEVRVPNFHSFIEGITTSYLCSPACWNSKTLWDIEEFHTPDVIRVGNAYCCTQCCGVLYYGAPPSDGNCFPHHKCHQQQYRTETPLMRYIKVGRTTEQLLDQYAIALHVIADYYDEASKQPHEIAEAESIAPFDIVTRTESIRSDRAVDPEFWTYPLERRGYDARHEIARAGWKMIDASSRSHTLPECLVSNMLHTRHVFSQMLTTTTIYDVAVTGKAVKFSPMVATMPTRGDGAVALSRGNLDHDVEDCWMDGFAFSPLIGGVGITGQFERGSCHNFGHPMIGSGKKASHYRNLFMESWRGWSKSCFTCAAGMEPAECESRLRGHARTMFGRSLPDICDFEETTHVGQSSAPLKKATKLSFLECRW